MPHIPPMDALLKGCQGTAVCIEFEFNSFQLLLSFLVPPIPSGLFGFKHDSVVILAKRQG